MTATVGTGQGQSQEGVCLGQAVHLGLPPGVRSTSTWLSSVLPGTLARKWIVSGAAGMATYIPFG